LPVRKSEPEHGHTVEKEPEIRRDPRRRKDEQYDQDDAQHDVDTSTQREHAGGAGERRGDRDTRSGNGIDRLRVEVRLIDDPGQKTTAQRPAATITATSMTGLRRDPSATSTASGNAARATGKLRNTSARPSPSATPVPVTW
jgi:hypothetical protein